VKEYHAICVRYAAKKQSQKKQAERLARMTY